MVGAGSGRRPMWCGCCLGSETGTRLSMNQPIHAGDWKANGRENKSLELHMPGPVRCFSKSSLCNAIEVGGTSDWKDDHFRKTIHNSNWDGVFQHIFFVEAKSDIPLSAPSAPNHWLSKAHPSDHCDTGRAFRASLVNSSEEP